MRFQALVTVLAASAAMAVASQAFALTTTWNEQSSSFGPFAGFQETSFLAGDSPFAFNVWDGAGRTIATASVTTNVVDSGVLSQINSHLFINTDADLYQIQITNPASFTATVASGTEILALFASDGTAISASRGGGVANQLTGTGLLPGLYYIGEGATDGRGATPILAVPENSSLQMLFDFSTNGVKAPVAGLSDYKLGTDPFTAWTVNGGGGRLLSSATLLDAGSAIALTGANFAVTPEPASLGVIGAGAMALLARRRRASR